MSTEMPLFPLHTVLFPGAPLQLHVFEPRYLALVEHCLATASPFGVVGIRQGVEVLGPLPEPHDVGCSAHVTSAARLPSGRLDVSAVGSERIRIEVVRRDQSYLVGLVSPMPMPPGDRRQATRAERQLRHWLGRYLSVLAAASETREDLSPARLPASPLALAYMAASLLRLPLRAKQDLLESPDLAGLLSLLGDAYRRELPVLQTLIGQPNEPGATPFSRN